MKRIFVRPAPGRAAILACGTVVPATGLTADLDPHVRRCLASGDLIAGEVSHVEPAPAPEPKRKG